LLLLEVRGTELYFSPVRGDFSTAATVIAPSSPRQVNRPLSTEGSFIPGETEEDGLLRREYVLVGDTRAVEFNRAVDGKMVDVTQFLQLTFFIEISAARRLPLHDRKFPPSPSSDDYSAVEFPVSSNANNTFPPPPSPYAPPLSSSPSSLASRAASNALNRAISLASKKLFGGTTSRPTSYRDPSVPPSPRRLQIIAGPETDREGERDPLEDALLSSLEELAQKTEVLTNWADEMYEDVKAIPQSENFHMSFGVNN
jgi:serine/threonine-protein kinase ULK/ATG1